MSVLGNAKSNSHRKTLQVELGGAARKYMFLLGEISAVRAEEKSAEAIVVMRPAERQEERRAEESRKNHSPYSAGAGHGGRRSEDGVATAATTVPASCEGRWNLFEQSPN
jgi:hypothetical protein